jgi:hypothetical protein
VEARRSLNLDSTNEVGTSIQLLDGNFTVRHNLLNYTLVSSGRQIGKNLVLKHEHIFHGIDPRSPLRVADVVKLPIRLCPHQTTSTNKPEEGRYTKSRLPGGLLFHSIVVAAPTSLLAGIPPSSIFDTPARKEVGNLRSWHGIVLEIPHGGRRSIGKRLLGERCPTWDTRSGIMNSSRKPSSIWILRLTMRISKRLEREARNVSCSIMCTYFYMS